VRGRHSATGQSFRYRLAVNAALAVIVAAVTIATVGVPPTLFVVGAWAFAALVNRSVSSLSGPASWVVGMVVESGILIFESGALAIVAPHRHPQWVYVTMLLVPLLIVGVLLRYLSLSGRLTPRRDAARMSGEPYLAIAAVVLIEAMFEAIKLHGHDFGLTWFMTGDARNQVIGTRQVLGAGGVTLKEMKTYPALVNAITAIFDGAGGRANLNAAALMVRDVQAMVATVVLCCVGIALCFMAALAETFKRGERYARRLPLYLLIPLGACGSVSIGALILGLGSNGGFLSAIGALVFALASLVLGLRILHHYDDLTLVVITLAMFLVVGSWTFLVVVPAAALVVGAVAGVRHSRHEGASAPSIRGVSVAAIVVGIAALSLVGVALALLFNGATLVAQLKSVGGIIAPNPRIFDWLGIVVMVVVAIAPGTQQRWARALLLVEFALLALVVVWMHTMHPAGVSWSYYATKMIWLATATVAWVPFVVLIDVLRGADGLVRRAGPRALTHVAVAAVGSSGVLWGISHETPYPFPWHWAFVGSTFPTPKMIEMVTEQANVGVPFVFWQYSSPADDKLGNFWSALTWDYNASGAVKPTSAAMNFPTWASSESGALSSLCQITSSYRLRIVTSNSRLVPTLEKDCPGYQSAPGQARTP